MTEEEMIEAEKLWCESCPNFDKERVGMDGYSICKASGSQVYAEGYERECRFRGVNPDNIAILPCRPGDKVWRVDWECEEPYADEREVTSVELRKDGKWIISLDLPLGEYWTLFRMGDNCYRTREECEQAIKELPYD